MNIVEFLSARIAEDEALAEECLLPENLRPYGDSRIPPIDPEGWGDLARNYLGGEMGEHCAQHNPLRVLAECEAKRAILKQHEEWPVLVEREPSLEQIDSLQGGIFRMTREIMWLTEREYVKRFGTAPPTAPMIRTMAAVYSGHPDYDPDWAARHARH